MKNIIKKTYIQLHYCLAVLFIILTSNLFSQFTPDWIQKLEPVFEAWPGYMHSGNTFDIDDNGNITVVGKTANVIIDIDQTATNYTFSSAYDADDIWVANYDSLGQVNWGFSIGANNSLDAPFGVAIDKNNNIWISGRFDKAIDLDPSAGNAILNITDNNRDLFIAKYDENGNFLDSLHFVTNYPNTLYYYIYQMKFDSQNNLVIAGTYINSFDIDPDTSISMLPNLPNLRRKGFVAKYNTNNSLLNSWAFTASIDFDILDMQLASDDGFFITGVYRGNCDFDLGNDTMMLNTINDGAFIARYDSLGNLLWAKDLEGDTYSRSLHLTVTDKNDVIVGGQFSGTITFPLVTNDTTVLNGSASVMDTDLFLVMYNDTGSAVWANHLPSTPQTQFNSIELNPVDSSVYITFSFSNDINLDYGISDFTLTTGTFPIFDMGVANYSYINGGFKGGFSLISQDLDYNYLHVKNNTIYMLGEFRNTLDLDTSVVVNNVTTTEDWALFLIKYKSNSIITDIGNNFFYNSEIDIYPNPVTEILKIVTDKIIKQVYITDLTGKILKTLKSEVNQIDVSDLTNGAYIIKVQLNDQIITKKFIKN